MGIVIKGGSTKITGQGRTNTGPTIPMDGLVMIVDPALAETTSSAYRLITPLTSSVLTATLSNISPGGGASSSVSSVVLRQLAYPTGAGSFGYLSSGSGGTLTVVDSRNVYIDVKGDALSYLQANVQNQLTILYWYSGFCPGISYPEVATDAFPNYKFSMLLNASPSPVFPVGQATSTTLPSAQMGFAGNVYAGASTYRIWSAAGLTTIPFSNTGSMTRSTTINIPASVNWGGSTPSPLQTASNPPSYTGHPATPNLPSFHRLLPMSSFAGRTVYRDNDTWNCFALTIQQTDRTITSSVYINGGLFGTAAFVTSSLTTGRVSGGSTELGALNITNNNQDTFFFTGSLIAGIGGGSTRIQIIPTSSGTFTDSLPFQTSTRTFYFSSGSTIGTTLQNLVNKINSTTGLSTYFTASLNGTSLRISSSIEGTYFNNTVTFNFSSSAQAINNSLFTFTGGTSNAGSGPITTTLLQAVPSGSALRIGVPEVAAGSGFYRNGLTGLLGATYIYNRALSQNEITQFYNALKSRYGNITPGNTAKNTYRLFNSAVSGSGALGIYEAPPSSSGIGY